LAQGVADAARAAGGLRDTPRGRWGNGVVILQLAWWSGSTKDIGSRRLSEGPLPAGNGAQELRKGFVCVFVNARGCARSKFEDPLQPRDNFEDKRV